MKLTAYLIGGQPVGTVVKSWTDTDLGGNPPFKAEETVSTGYQDISSAENWDAFGTSAGLDYKEISDEIATLVTANGYASFTDEGKKAALRRFVAGAGIDFVDALYTAQQHSENNIKDAEYLRACFKKRDEFIYCYMKELVLTGVLPMARAQIICTEVKVMRDNFRTDMIEGSEFDTLDAIADYLKNISSYAPKPITNVLEVASVLKKFVIAGDWTSQVNNDSSIEVEGSTFNDGEYTVVSVSEVAGNTEIEVSETIPNSTVDGNLYLNGLRSYKGITPTLQTDFVDIYKGKKKQ